VVNFSDAFDEICGTQDFSDYYLRIYCVFAKLWLHVKAEMENIIRG